MPRIRKFNNSAKFKGNRYSKIVQVQHNLNENITQTVETRPRPSSSDSKRSSSSKKLLDSKLPKNYEYDQTNVNAIINLPLICELVKSFTSCKACGAENCILISVDDGFTNGLAHRIIIICDNCKAESSCMNSNVVHNLHEVNIRFAYALRSIGKGIEAGKMLCAVMNLAPPNKRVQHYYEKILPKATEVCGASLRNAAEEAENENEGNGDIAAAFDGTWQKRGFTSLNGVMTVTSFDTGKVLDFECLSKFCVSCSRGQYKNKPEELEKHKKICKANFTGSSGAMEVRGAEILCGRSEEKLGLRYTRYLGDGDSKGFISVVESKPYGEEVSLEKLECVGHVQKRLGTRLRNLKKTLKGVKLSDGKVISGKGRLTDTEIDNLQRYYGLAIRDNATDLKKMKDAVWATFYHKLSTDEDPQHHLCPPGKDSWCKYNQAVANKRENLYKHDNSLPEPVLKAIKPIYHDLADENLLRRCLHGKTQNPNESLNQIIWKRLPKTEFVGLTTLKLGVTDAVTCFNDGSVSKINVLQQMGIKPGKFTVEGLKTIDRVRILKADKEVNEQNKKKRIRRRLMKRTRDEEDATEQDYIPGGF